MRESNFAFPAQNRACVCITSQLYDRRALDTNSPLPLFNSLSHLTYLTSTSPRIREIMTVDGGLERLLQILHEFCMCPPPPENPALMYGLTPAGSHPPKLTPTLNPVHFDKHAAYRFSIAFQCVVNIGVRGSEPIRSRVVQAGALNVVGCILEAWLANKGFPVGPKAYSAGHVRESREQRHARRVAREQELKQREEAAELDRALQRSIRFNQRRNIPEDESAQSSESNTSTENSLATTPIAQTSSTSTIVVSTRERSGTIIARPNRTIRDRQRASPSPDTDASSRPETETEDDADVDMDRSLATVPPPPRTVAIVSDDPAGGPPSIQVNSDDPIIINDGGRGVEGVVDNGIVSLETNDDFAMGAPPGAPGAIQDAAGPPRTRRAVDATPRAGIVSLPVAPPDRNVPGAHRRTDTIRANRAGGAGGGNGGGGAGAGGNPVNLDTIAPSRSSHHHHSHHRDAYSGPYRDEDVLLALQLLAYLSKYPHVRQAFYKPCTTFHPASAHHPGIPTSQSAPSASSAANASSVTSAAAAVKGKAPEMGSFAKAFSFVSRGKEKEKTGGFFGASSSSSSTSSSSTTPTSATSSSNGTTNGMSASGSSLAVSTNGEPPLRQTNVFSLVERFTFRPSSSEMLDANGHPPPRLPGEIRYWAGVIMRNACRKDDSRGGIRQCANMMCGKWESYPREFAKCRRCRKAKYCGKECQSTAWNEGHRFWCSAKEADEEVGVGAAHHHDGQQQQEQQSQRQQQQQQAQQTLPP